MTDGWFKTVRRGDGVVALAGELDAVGAAQLHEMLAEASAPLRLDLSDVSFIDSTALHVILSARERFGDGFAIVSASRVVRRLFELTATSGLLLTDGDDPPNTET